MAEEELLTSQQAADYLGMTRQSISLAAKRREIGKRYGAVYMFTRSELDAWYGRHRLKPGRPPKIDARTPSPVVMVA